MRWMLVSTALLNGSATGCAQTILVDRDAPVNPIVTDSGDPDGDACASDARETVRLEVEFPEREAGCGWGEGGNLDPEQSVVTARTEDVVSIEMPAAARLCDISLDFGGDDEDPFITYDDHFLLTLDDAVLAASYAPLVDLLESDGHLRLYDWERLVGAPFSFEAAGTYCLGREEGLSTCTIPPPATPGALVLDFGDDVVGPLVEYAHAQGRYAFAFVVVGDNDPYLDCAHTAFRFTVEVTYVPA